MKSELIAGAVIAIASGLIVQFANYLLDFKKEKRKFIFEKITDIINSISNLNEGLQQDAATVFGVGPPDKSSKEISLELIRIKCLVKIYHPKLSSNVDKLITTINNYFSAKRNFINSQRPGATKEQLNMHAEIIKTQFEQVTTEIETFITSLSEYSQS